MKNIKTLIALLRDKKIAQKNDVIIQA